MEKRIKIGEEESKGYDTKELLKQVIHLQTLYRPLSVASFIDQEKVKLKKRIETMSNAELDSSYKMLITGMSSQKVERLLKGDFRLMLSLYEAILYIPSLAKFTEEVEFRDLQGIIPYEVYIDDLERTNLPHSVPLLFYGFDIKQVSTILEELITLHLNNAIPSSFMEFRYMNESGEVVQERPPIQMDRGFSNFELNVALDETSIFESFSSIHYNYTHLGTRVILQVRTVHLFHYFATLAHK